VRWCRRAWPGIQDGRGPPSLELGYMPRAANAPPRGSTLRRTGPTRSSASRAGASIVEMSVVGQYQSPYACWAGWRSDGSYAPSSRRRATLATRPWSRGSGSLRLAARVPTENGRSSRVQALSCVTPHPTAASLGRTCRIRRVAARSRHRPLFRAFPASRRYVRRNRKFGLRRVGARWRKPRSTARIGTTQRDLVLSTYDIQTTPGTSK
jgi:hypothetical protein